MRVLTLVGFRLNFISFWFLGRAFTLYYAWFLIFTLITRVLDLKKQTIRQLLFMFFDSKLTLLGLIYYHTCVSVANLRNLNNTDTFYTILFEMDLQRIIIPIIREPLDVKRERTWWNRLSKLKILWTSDKIPVYLIELFEGNFVILLKDIVFVVELVFIWGIDYDFLSIKKLFLC